MLWKYYVKVTRDAEYDNNDSGSDWDFDDGTGTNSDPGPITVCEKYPCTIIKKVTSYDTSEQGQSYTGKAKLKGMLTDKLKEGDVVDGQYKIVGRIVHPHNRYTQANLVRIN